MRCSSLHYCSLYPWLNVPNLWSARHYRLLDDWCSLPGVMMALSLIVVWMFTFEKPIEDIHTSANTSSLKEIFKSILGDVKAALKLRAYRLHCIILAMGCIYKNLATGIFTYFVVSCNLYLSTRCCVGTWYYSNDLLCWPLSYAFSYADHLAHQRPLCSLPE